MADYYGLLARAIQALKRNDKPSRTEIYAKARHVLIRKLKAINPPLPPEEISKQQLSLEEAIRRVEREAAEAAAAAMLSDEEIGRQAEQALEEALSPDTGTNDPYLDPEADEYATDPYAAPNDERDEASYRQPPQPPLREPETSRRQPPPIHDPDEYRQRRQPPEGERAPHPSQRPPPTRQADDYRQQRPPAGGDRSVHTPQQPPPQEPSAPRRHAGAERVQFEPPPRRPEPEVMPPRTAFSAEEQTAGGEDAYAEVVTSPVWPRAPSRGAPSPTNWDRAATVTDVEQPSPAQAKRQERAARSNRGGRGWELQHRRGKRGRLSMRSRLAVAAVLLVVVAGAGYYAWSEWENVSDYVATLFDPTNGDIAEVEVDPTTGDPIVFAEPVAYYYEEPNADGLSPKYSATVEWILVQDEDLGAVVAAHIEIPDRGISLDFVVGESPAPGASHEVSVATTLTSRAEPLSGVGNVAVKTSEEAIGLELEGEVEADPSLYVLELPEASARVNTNRFATSPWFDIALVFESGQRAVVAFSKGTVGSGYFTEAIEAWGN